ncbi:hypothetical protein HUG10_16030 [Halorarum halophilum]|uniref:Uncharacterized protein n=1 Tax=Halorarum halophilum TaxID=2743090 RepID=A0A7D5L311_9EURY|nr:hypothetical protein HUG10_16030 [Halobaculum halophilum]
MVTDTAPEASDDLPQHVVDALNRQDPQTLCQTATHSKKFASWKEVHAEVVKEEEDVVREGRTDNSDRPEGVPAKANIVEKNINDNRYYYQWHEGEKMKSKYKGPVDAGD